jgi:ubiquinol-cytochrome c reductase cytochrome c1 subunit
LTSLKIFIFVLFAANIIHYFMNITRKFILATFATGIALTGAQEDEKCFIYRDDIGAHWGIKGYEEMVTEVGTHHGRLSWPQFRAWGTYDSGSVRRGTHF